MNCDKIRVSSLHAVSQPLLAYPFWFKNNAPIGSHAVNDPLPAFFFNRLNRDDFISLDPENVGYLHARSLVHFCVDRTFVFRHNRTP